MPIAHLLMEVKKLLLYLSIEFKIEEEKQFLTLIKENVKDVKKFHI